MALIGKVLSIPLTLDNKPDGERVFFIKNHGFPLRIPTKSTLINQHRISVGFGEVVENGAQHRST